MKERRLEVKSENNLLPFLIKEAFYSKNKAKSLLKYDNVLVNGRVVNHFDYKLKIGDIVTLTNTRKVISPFEIVYEDSEFLVINKKSKLLTVSFDAKDISLYKQAVKYLELKNTKEQLFVLHRLDKETSGIVVFCKSKELTKALQDDWIKFAKVRAYCAVVEGVLAKKEDTLTLYLKENGEKCVTVTSEKFGKKAITKYRVVKENKDYSLLNIRLLTGRKNQIRATFAHFHHPIVGDRKYYAKSNPIERVALVANYFELIHPYTKKVYKFEVGIPKSFEKIVK